MIKVPPNQVAFDINSKPNPMWVEFMSEVYKGLLATQLSGTTAQRPVQGLYVGRQYFDTTLGYQINYNGTAWVNGQGIVV